MQHPSRREVLVAGAATAACAALAPAMPLAPNPQHPQNPEPDPPRRGRLKQSVCRWCYGRMSLDDLCTAAAAMGVKSVELLGEKEWGTPARHGLVCAVANGPTTIPRGLNRPELHDAIVRESERLLPLVRDVGIPNLIVFSGNRDGMSDAEGLRNCAAGLKRLTPLAESLGVTLVMELLNSRVDHADYMCDRTAWGAALVEEVGSERFKLLYDIYHMQIMEGDVIRTIRRYAKHIGHYHTAGNPGRNELDDTQELNYRAICTAIVESGFTGYLGQEFIPRRDPMQSLAEAVQLCDV